jgi:hypothetical protein
MKKIIKHYPMTDRLIVRRGYIIQLLTFVEVNIRIYHSKIYDIYQGFGLGKYHISWNEILKLIEMKVSNCFMI